MFRRETMQSSVLTSQIREKKLTCLQLQEARSEVVWVSVQGHCYDPVPF